MEYGELNGHSVGIIMKEMVRRAITAIRRERFLFEATRKENIYKADGKEDFVTTADKAAQRIYVKTIQECFPRYGIVAEEDELKVACTDPLLNIFFTIDPLDGTKAFMRRQSHGVGTMVSLVCNGKVIAAAVGDVMTEEIYYFRPESDKVHRLSEFNQAEVLTIDPDWPLHEQYVLLGDDPQIHSPLVIELVHPKGLAFKDIEVSGGSIGIRMARLWKGEVGAVILRPGYEMPWDINPIIGISQRLGFDFWTLYPLKSILSAEILNLPATADVQKWPFETLITHSSHRSEVESMFS
jgi:fructose-1,6-bisphosphatase/inositol monophosphatase family enzyme